MQNAYISSTIYSFRTKGSVFNDCSYLLNERFDRNPIPPSLISTSTSCCCDCCAFSTPRVPINPCYLYGLRRTSLFQWSASRRLILGGRDRFYYRVQECGAGPGCYELSCSLSERSGYSRGGRRGKGRCGCVVDEEGESEVCDSDGFSDVESVLSLLSEEVGGERFGRERNGFKRAGLEGRRRNVGLSKRVEEESRRSLSGSRRNVGSSKRVEEESRRRSLSGSKRNVSSSKRVEAERRSFVGREKSESSVKGREKIESVSKGVQVDFEESNRSECSSGEKKSNGRYSSLESNSKHRLESTRVELSEKDSRQKEETGLLLRAENHRGRKEGSSGSSYYSLSSGDFGSEADVHDKHGLLEEPGSSVYKDSHYDRGRFDGRISEEYRNRRDDVEANSEILKQRNTAVEGGGMWDWRKKSEKKLTEVVIEETQASKKSSEKHSRVLKTNESELAKASGSHKQFNDERENSYLTWRTKEQYSQTGNQDVVETESRRKFQEGKEKLEVHRTDAETSLRSQKRLSDREQNLAMATNLVQETRDEHYKTTGHITQREDLNIDIQKLSRVSQVQVVDTERTSNWRRQSDTRTNQEENTNMGLISVEGTEEQCDQISHQLDQKVIQRVQSRKGTNDAAEMSYVHASDTARNTNSQRTFDKRTTNQGSITVLAATSVEETVLRNNQTDEKLMQVKSRKEAQSSTEVSTFPEKYSGEPSSFQASLSMVSQAGMQREDVEGHKRSPQAPLLPPPPQLIARGSARIEFSSETATQEVSGETSESNSALNYESCGGNSNTETPAEILYLDNPEDALGSAHRLEESSSQFIGELFEKIRYGVSTSENQTAQRVSGATLVYGGEKYGQKTLTSSSSGNGTDETQGENSYLINPEDALGSAQRLEKSSSEFVGEFSEKARHEASTSEEYGAEISEAKWVPGGEKHGQRTSSQYGSEDSQLKGNQSRRSSGGSGTKGPSVEMWDVTDTSTLKSPEEEKPEATTTSEKSEATTASEKLEATTTSGNAVAKKTGRSIWNVVADIVKLRWISHAETHHSGARSGDRISSTESGSSEAWFSGRETEENSEKNVKREKGMQPETTSDQLQPAKSFSQSEKASGTVKSKDKVRYLETSMTSSPNKEESRSTSKSVSLSSGEETLSPKDNQKNFRGSSSGIQIVESSQSQIASGIKSPVVEEISNAGYTVSGSVSKDNQKNFRGSSSGIQIVESSQSQIASGIKSPVVEEVSNAGYTLSGNVSKDNQKNFRGSSSGIQIVESSQSQIASGIKSPVVEEVSNAGYTLSGNVSKDNQKNFRGSSSGIQIVESSQSQIASGIKSPVVEEISNAGYTVSGSGSEENRDQFGRQKSDEESDNVQKGAELKQRKLQRNKQVLKDRFDEWEEAQNSEIEQRKTDEFFMREALLEAKKAADTWEVPVGAVLVQQGKVIARGFNLVEELRDSTAHAEMICIREASNVLRTWRLAESTLYVTLEPCAMCAGAILQARVDTVVWGAPNKLLGADGSWIRLFPDGGQGSESEQSEKPAAPVHPFHPNITIRRGVLASECADIMQQFFQLRRKKKEKRQAGPPPPPPPSTRAVSHHPRKLLTKLHDIFHIMFCL